MRDREPFTCVICGYEHAVDRYKSPKIQHIPPVCLFCESNKGRSWTGRPYGPQVKHGSFRDRRIALQINALTDAIEHAAYRAIHGW